MHVNTFFGFLFFLKRNGHSSPPFPSFSALFLILIVLKGELLHISTFGGYHATQGLERELVQKTSIFLRQVSSAFAWNLLWLQLDLRMCKMSGT